MGRGHAVASPAAWRGSRMTARPGLKVAFKIRRSAPGWAIAHMGRGRDRWEAVPEKKRAIMRSLLLGSILAIAMTACLGPASDPPPPTSQPALDDPAKANPSGDVRPPEPAARSTPPIGDDHPPIDTLAGTTWQEQTAEVCADWFSRFCTSTFPRTAVLPGGPGWAPMLALRGHLLSDAEQADVSLLSMHVTNRIRGRRARFVPSWGLAGESLRLDDPRPHHQHLADHRAVGRLRGRR